MANLTEYVIAKHSKMLVEICTDLSVQFDKAAELLNIIKGLKNPDILFAGAPLTLDRIQVMEDGSIRITPAQPILPEPCNQAVTKKFGKNGKAYETATAEYHATEAAHDPA
jgi:hypothetical protein